MDKTAKVKDSVGNRIMRAMLDELMILSPRYKAMNQEQQQQTIDRLRDVLMDSIEDAVHEISARSYQHLPAKIIKAQIKNAIQFQVDVIGTPTDSSWTERIGKQVMLVFCDPEGFIAGLPDFRAPDNQGDIFEDEA